jgi:hypothetical protein
MIYRTEGGRRGRLYQIRYVPHSAGTGRTNFRAGYTPSAFRVSLH